MTVREMIEQEAVNMESGNYESTWEYRDVLTRVAEAAAREAVHAAEVYSRGSSYGLSEQKIKTIVAAVLGEAK